MGFSTFILAYLGPETMLPMTSAVAGVAGVVLLFGKNSFRWGIQMGRGLMGKVGLRPKATSKGRRKIGVGPVGRSPATEAKRETSA